MASPTDMTLNEAFDAAGATASLAIKIYQQGVDALCHGTAQSLQELEEKRRIAHEAERDLQSFHIQLLAAVANPLKRQSLAEIIVQRADQANQLLASLDQSFERVKATGERLLVTNATLHG